MWMEISEWQLLDTAVMRRHKVCLSSQSFPISIVLSDVPFPFYILNTNALLIWLFCCLFIDSATFTV